MAPVSSISAIWQHLLQAANDPAAQWLFWDDYDTPTAVATNTQLIFPTAQLQPQHSFNKEMPPHLLLAPRRMAPVSSISAMKVLTPRCWQSPAPTRAKMASRGAMRALSAGTKQPT
jgi:hypothetical protein